MSTLTKTILQNTYLHVGFAFLAMGGWAFYANSNHPMPQPLIASILQGGMSALLTLYLKKTVDWLRPKMSRTLGYFIPPLLASLGSIALLFSAHKTAGTPEILTTIAVPLIVSVSYIFTYNILRQLKNEER